MEASVCCPTGPVKCTAPMQALGSSSETGMGFYTELGTTTAIEFQHSLSSVARRSFVLCCIVERLCYRSKLSTPLQSLWDSLAYCMVWFVLAGGGGGTAGQRYLVAFTITCKFGWGYHCPYFKSEE